MDIAMATNFRGKNREICLLTLIRHLDIPKWIGICDANRHINSGDYFVHSHIDEQAAPLTKRNNRPAHSLSYIEIPILGYLGFGAILFFWGI